MSKTDFTESSNGAKLNYYIPRNTAFVLFVRYFQGVLSGVSSAHFLSLSDVHAPTTRTRNDVEEGSCTNITEERTSALSLTSVPISA